MDPNRRPVNMVFQSYAVFPHMKVFDNVAYGLNVTGVAKDEISKRVEEVLGLVQLDGFGSRKPDQLSGGQRQRVAVMEAERSVRSRRRANCTNIPPAVSSRTSSAR